MLDTLTFGSRVILPVPLQQIDTAPYTQTTAQGNNKGLQNVYCTVEKFHKISSLSAAFAAQKRH